MFNLSCVLEVGGSCLSIKGEVWRWDILATFGGGGFAGNIAGALVESCRQRYFCVSSLGLDGTWCRSRLRMRQVLFASGPIPSDMAASYGRRTSAFPSWLRWLSNRRVADTFLKSSLPKDTLPQRSSSTSCRRNSGSISLP